MDDLEELLVEEAFADDGELKNETEAMTSLAKRVKHLHASKDGDGYFSFLANPHEGSFPATVIDVYS